ncbi:MAG: fibrobacter succinogenes major paralogous domain-containing protein [Dysgonamonadaceae bacterium]|nr:fibrobacter succinogenes major paralogous domain-containing protein [Dysgonamonadaceae bacterium]
MSAQVTIGGMTDPKDGALLDLNSTAKDGLLLSNVSLTDLEKIPGGVFVGISGEQDNNTELTGMIVYNTNINTGRGLYVWNGVKWTTFTIGDGDFDPLAPGEVGVLKDLRDNETYLTGDFGDAGIWMLENLRYVPKAAEGYAHNGTSSSTATTDKYYAFPSPNTNSYDDSDGLRTDWLTNRKRMGVLYNWAGATDGENTSNSNDGNKDYLNDKHPKIQGICPEGWYLPSDWDWSDLTSVIDNDATGLYSDLAGTGSIGKKMKSTTDVNTTDTNDTNGSSNTAEDGGFDVLLVGFVYSNSRGDFGTYTYFWSSSSANGTYAWRRYLSYGDPGVSRNDGSRPRLFSVRCKKD